MIGQGSQNKNGIYSINQSTVGIQLVGKISYEARQQDYLSTSSLQMLGLNSSLQPSMLVGKNQIKTDRGDIFEDTNGDQTGNPVYFNYNDSAALRMDSVNQNLRNDSIQLERDLLASNGLLNNQNQIANYSSKTIRLQEVNNENSQRDKYRGLNSQTQIRQNHQINGTGRVSALNYNGVNPTVNLKEKLQNLASSAIIGKRMNYFLNNFTSSRRRLCLENIHIRWTIDDKSDVVSVSNQVFLLFRILADIKQKFNKMAPLTDHINVGLINSNSWLSIFLLVFFTIFNGFFFIILSISLIYIGQTEYDLVAHLSIAIIWIIEALIHLNTMIYQGSDLVCDRYLIAMNYIKNRSLSDFIGIILLFFMPDQTKARTICQIIIFIKVDNLFKDIAEVQKHLCMSVKNFPLVQLMNLCVQIIVFGHIVACAWFLIGQFELKILEYETTWYDEGLGADYIWWKLYLESIYWSLTLLTTGSNIAFSLMQMLFTTTAMLGTTIMFGYMLNVTGSIISQFDAQDQKKRLDLNIINEYMRQNKISKELQTRVNLDIENYYFANLNEFKVGKQEILSKISPNLQRLLRLEYCNQILEHMPIIKEKFSVELQEELSDCIEEVYYLPNQTILQNQQYEKLSLMLITQGSVDIMQSINKDSKILKRVKQLGKKQLLGQVNFFTGRAHDRLAKSCEFTKIVQIDRQMFIEIAKKREKDYQVFMELKDQLFIHEDFERINEKCQFCENFTHTDSECSLVHIQKFDIIQKLKFFENINQERREMSRNQINKNRNRVDVADLVNTVKEFQRICKEEMDEHVMGFGSEEYDSREDDESESTFNSTSVIKNDGEEISYGVKVDIIANESSELDLKDLMPFSVIELESLPNQHNKDTIAHKNQSKYHLSKYQADNGLHFLQHSIKESPYLGKESIDETICSLSFREKISTPDQSERCQEFVVCNLEQSSPIHRKITMKKEKLEARTKSSEMRMKTSIGVSDANIIRSEQHLSNKSQVFQISRSQQQLRSSIVRNQLQNLKTNNNMANGEPRKLSLEDNQHASRLEMVIPQFLDWDFDKQRDFKFYFPKGNVRTILSKKYRMQRKRVKEGIIKRKSAHKQSVLNPVSAGLKKL